MNSFLTTLKTAAQQEPALRIEKLPDGVVAEGSLPKRIHNAIVTIDDDPGNHKKKALAGFGGAALASIGGAVAISKLPKANVPVGTEPSTTALLAIPAGTYYAMQNRDNVDKRNLGLATAAAGLVVANKGAGVANVPQLTNAQRLTAAAALATPTALATYGVHELHKAEQIKREQQALATSTQPKDGVDLINKSKNTDLVDKYPLLSLSNLKERFKAWLA